MVPSEGHGGGLALLGSLYLILPLRIRVGTLLILVLIRILIMIGVSLVFMGSQRLFQWIKAWDSLRRMKRGSDIPWLC